MLESAMTSTDPFVSALQALCAREGGHDAVAKKIGANGQSLYQIVSERRLPSGNPKGVGPALRAKLTARFPDWLGNTDRQSGNALGLHGFTARDAHQSAPTLAQALEVVAAALSSVPVEKRQALLGVLATYASDPVQESNSLSYLQSELAKTQARAGVHPSSIATGQPPGGKV